MFEDVPPMLRMLSEEGFMLYVYSSGSIESQKLLFANTTEGDITDVCVDHCLLHLLKTFLRHAISYSRALLLLFAQL